MSSRTGNEAFFWFACALCSIVVAFAGIFVSGNFARQESILEAKKIEAVFGEQTLLTINRISADWYRKVEPYVSEPLSWSEEREAAAKYKLVKSFWKWAQTRSDALLDLTYWLMRRFALFIIWMPFWIPMFVMATLHGYWDREIKKTDFGYTSPVVNYWSRRVMHVTTLVVLLCFIVPLALEPWIFPVFMCIFTVFSGLAIGNVQKRI